ncbi:bacillithiol biosynthesis deacetylase BshB1 [Pullulanibacillus camelliae]|uniref:Bacillithiol biosynthesis deacetylase BshB1 n=1 Tax=Pullulanibacillus camelliae TaxID=1707096 RepID=A0A8J2VRP5_9BACL|nr:bacillithiol biosynthesis deacetylase BshB1 [Pullulanibacillus camelliae]
MHASQGYKVGICDLTMAELSSNGTVALRQREAALASELLNVTERLNVKLPDRGLTISPETIATLVDVIRTYQPRVVFAPYFIDRHPDHGHCSKLVEEAVFSAGIHKFQGQQALPSHKAEELYFYFINGFHTPDFCVDVTAVHEQKMCALSAYKSQFAMTEKTVATPLTSDYLETVESRDRLFGKEVGVRFAEGFKSKRPLRVKSVVR